MLIGLMEGHQKFPKSHKCGIAHGCSFKGKVQEGTRDWHWYFSMYSYCRSNLCNLWRLCKSKASCHHYSWSPSATLKTAGKKKQKSWQQQNISLDAWSTKLQHYLTLYTRLGWLSDLHFRLGRHRAGKGDLCQCKQKCFDRDTTPGQRR